MSSKNSGTDIIREFLKTLPALPGVYRMMNAAGDALYVGKAKNLKKRVTAYTMPEKHGVRIQHMIVQTAAMDFTPTHTEAEALLLEANLIKKLKPRYNILLRDDKSFPYILITGDHDFPQVVKHRGAKSRQGEYFGPFASGLAVNETITVLHKAFQLRNCSDNVFALRTRPCLQYQIKRCTAPCVNKVSKEQYAQQVAMARQFLQGKSRKVQEQLAREMQAASARRDFEMAALLRDRIRALTHIQSRQNISVQGLGDMDVHALYQDKGQSCIQVIFFRGGQNFGSRFYFPRHDKEEMPENILSAFIVQFYDSRPAPKEIMASHAVVDKSLIEKALTIGAGCKVTVTQPVRGRKKEVIDSGVGQAKESLARRRAAESSQVQVFDRLMNLFDLDAPPERIEVYDNSHISGKHALGAMIVASPEGFQKNAYRKFNMPDHIRPGDDVAMMREMLFRRFSASSKEEGGASLPDIVLVDGGQGQLNVALSVLDELRAGDVAIVAIAKGPDRNAGRERFFMRGQKPVSLDPDDPVLYYLQRLRDEAHRFAITSHRGKRSRAFTQNLLDDIPGIGSGRKKALLLHFGSAKAVAEAGVADLQKVMGISKPAAERIYDFFHMTEG